MTPIKRTILLVIGSALAAVSVYAHSQLNSTKPAAGEVLTSSPTVIELTFKILVQSSMSSIAVTDASGRRVDDQDLDSSADGKIIRVGVKELQSGIYRVDWRALSADDHTIAGDFSFEVRLPAEDVPLAAPQVPATDPRQPTSLESHNDHAGQFSLTSPNSLVRWLQYLALMGLAGGFVFRVFVIGPALNEVRDFDPNARTGAAEAAYDLRFTGPAFKFLGLLVAASVAGLIMQSANVFEVGGAEALEPARLYRVLSETSFGFAWMMRIGAAAVLLLILILIASALPERRAGLYMSGIGMCGVLLLTPALTGHARAAAADYSLSIFSDWLHLVAAAVWVGGLFQIAIGVPALLAALDGPAKLAGLSAVVSAFNRLAVGSILLIAVTGIYNSWIHVDSVSSLFNTPYGIVLLLKIGLAVVMIALGGVNSFVIHPMISRQLRESGDPPKAASERLFKNVQIEIALGIVVLLLAGVLAITSPTRKHSPAPRSETAALNTFKYE